MDILAIFANPNVRDLGAVALLGLVVLMVLTGRLVPKSVSDAWRDAYFKAQEANAVKDQAIAQFAEAGIVTARALDALPQPGGDPDVDETTETRRRRRQS